MRADHEAWRALRILGREHLEKWEPRWPENAHDRADWINRLKSWNTGWRSGRAYVFFIWMAGTRDLVGGVSFTNVRGWPAQSANLGYWLGEAYQGHGYMREAVSAACNWTFHALDLQRIEAGTLPQNKRSMKVLESVGFKHEGYAEKYLEIQGKREDHVLFGLVRDNLKV